MLKISDKLSSPDEELDWHAVRASGPGGQNVNKVSSAVHLRFDIASSQALDEESKERLLRFSDRRISRAGVIVIKSQRFRQQERNREDAIDRLRKLILMALAEPVPRKPTKPSSQSKQKRLEDKARRSKLKETRRKPLE